ncbi:YggS family pyridoxal phosphate-dependent enzyme [Peristeroidobacter soli]|jgi:pyridoxal phosphate enzyme (YggS family)|uniref:YggS family pyridoxal phosphate-dependent enzyme n=1 Tax=Peristeroidobacter soli TaxID=2497877 RepID=UPI00101C3DF9|nr:YggS family pyridoxal phosphate-dependent enzyme [Peristeroidobacter soli]
MLTGPQISADTVTDSASSNLANNWTETRQRIATVASQWGRLCDSVGLVAISKGHPASCIRALAALGQRDFGENYLQEALPKLQELQDLKLTWHFTGQLQGNKTRPVAEQFDWVHTLDRERIAIRLNEQRPHYAPPLNICVQVSLRPEPGKGGVTPEELLPLAQRVATLPKLKLRGLMCIPPPRDTFEEQRALFEELVACQRQLLDAGLAVDTLSMGMSEDLEAAVAAGATWVRIGTAIFGKRPTR